MSLARDGNELTVESGAGRRRSWPLSRWSRIAAGVFAAAASFIVMEAVFAEHPLEIAGGGVAANRPASLALSDLMLVEMTDLPLPAHSQGMTVPRAMPPVLGSVTVSAAPADMVVLAPVQSMAEFGDRGTVRANAPIELQLLDSKPAFSEPVEYEPLFLVNASGGDDLAGAFNDNLIAQAPQPAPLNPMNLQPTANPDPLVNPVGHDASPSPELPSPVVGAMVVPAEEIVSAIHQGGTKSTLINIYKGESVAIDLKCKIDRAETADPRVATVNPDRFDRLIVTGTGFGATQMRIYCGGKQANFSINVELNLTTLRNLVRSISPASQVDVRSVNGTVLLTGTVPDVATSERIADLATLFEGGKVQNQITVAGVQQTMIRVVVAEVNKTAIRNLGVNWAMGASNWSRDFFFANNINQINPTVFSSNGLGNIVAPNPAGQLLYSVAPTANGLNTNVTFGFPRAEFQMFVNALRENQLFRVLAEPNLVCISGQTASFLAGGEVPIPVTQGGAAVGAIVIEYKEFGVRLHFTPTVVGRQLVRLHVLSEFSDAIPGPAVIGGLPAFSFTTRRVESTVECGNGQTFAIAGLLSERVQAISSKLPALGDIPVLGALFQSVNYQKTNTELVIMVTPELVQPLDPQQVGPPPGSLMTDPNDYELFLLGQLEGTPNPPPDSEGIPRHEQPVKTQPLATSGSPSRATMHGSWGLSEIDGD